MNVRLKFLGIIFQKVLRNIFGFLLVWRWSNSTLKKIQSHFYRINNTEPSGNNATFSRPIKHQRRYGVWGDTRGSLSPSHGDQVCRHTKGEVKSRELIDERRRIALYYSERSQKNGLPI